MDEEAVGTSTVDTADTVVVQKDYGDAPAYMPGATSFAEFDAMHEAQEYQEDQRMLFSQLQMIQQNIINSDMPAPQKASAVGAATTEFQNRLNKLTLKEAKALADAEKAGRRINSAKLGLFERIVKDLKDFMSWASYDDGRDDDEKALEVPSAFKVFRDKAGDLRWLSYSSNAFEDLDKELFTTDALKEAVAYGDKTGERGPLLIYHVPSAVIGQCDYQAVIGRILVESGTFDDTPLGKKATEYFETTDREHQVSVGFKYNPGDEKDGVFDWLVVVERSTTPYGKAANPWTEFRITGGKAAMDKEKEAELKRILGDDLAKSVIDQAEDKTKELEDKVRFKEKAVEDDKASAPKNVNGALASLAGMLKDIENPAVRGKFADLIEAARELAKDSKDLASDIANAEIVDVTGEPDEPAETVVVTGESEASSDVGAAAIIAMADAVTKIGGQVSALTDRVGALDREIKEAKATYEGSPRYSPANGKRPSEDDSNVVGDDIKAKLPGSGEDQENNPVAPFLKQLGLIS
jgi:ubiquinone biosynthesis protein UbiJ